MIEELDNNKKETTTLQQEEKALRNSTRKLQKIPPDRMVIETDTYMYLDLKEKFPPDIGEFSK